MAAFSIITSRAAQTDIETTDQEVSEGHVLEVAELLHTTITLDDLQFDGIMRGTYLHNGRTERIIIVETTAGGGASAADVIRAITWMNKVNE